MLLDHRQTTAHSRKPPCLQSEVGQGWADLVTLSLLNGLQLTSCLEPLSSSMRRADAGQCGTGLSGARMVQSLGGWFGIQESRAEPGGEAAASAPTHRSGPGQHPAPVQP